MGTSGNKRKAKGEEIVKNDLKTANVDSSYTQFQESVKSLNYLLSAYSAEIVVFTEDNSFPMLMNKIKNNMIYMLDQAIGDNEIDLKKVDIKIGDIDRFIATIEKNLIHKTLSTEANSCLQKIILFMKNWVNLVDQYNLEDHFEIKKIEMKNKLEMINLIDQNLQGYYSLERLIEVTNKLISKAESLIAVEPPNFKLSRHYLDALDALEKNDG